MISWLCFFRSKHGGLPARFDSCRKFICEQCGDEFLSSATLWQHKTSHHPIKGLSKNLTCEHCGRGGDNNYHKFKTPNQLMRHYRIDHPGLMPSVFRDQPKFVCAKCPDFFISQVALRICHLSRFLIAEHMKPCLHILLEISISSLNHVNVRPTGYLIANIEK